jgi:hypothetical protein
MKLETLRSSLEFLAGSCDEAPTLLTGRYGAALRCCVWIAAIALIYAFCGQSSKFIYIDF